MYKGQILLLQSRLVATLNKLDIMQTAHSEELAAAQQAHAATKVKLNAYEQTLREAEAERDDMRDVMLILIKKGMSGILL